MPLPNPRINESRNNFISRCMEDNQIIEDFDTINQRYAVCNNLYSDRPSQKQFKLDRKKFRRAYSLGYRKLFKKAATQNNKLTYEYYKKGFRNSIKEFLKSNDLDGSNYVLFFQNSNTEKMFMDIYTKTSLLFYNWYLDNYKKFIKKLFGTEQTMQNFINNYVKYSARINQKITSVQKTAIKNVITIFQSVMQDPDFLKESMEGKAKILQTKLDGRALWEARRIVVTETTLAANLGAEKAALSAFKPEQLLKDWIQGFSMNHRIGHEILSSQDPIPMTENFINPETGVSMRIPGEGPSSEVINCSCYVAFIPNPAVFDI
tara:strand:+ start:18 stop:974 length:957 start_codon:yes stop_codon:yes gene_type:complete